MPSTEEFYPDGPGAGPLSYVARVRNFMEWVGQALELIDWDLRFASGRQLKFGDAGEFAAGYDGAEEGMNLDALSGFLNLRMHQGDFNVRMMEYDGVNSQAADGGALAAVRGAGEAWAELRHSVSGVDTTRLRATSYGVQIVGTDLKVAGDHFDLENTTPGKSLLFTARNTGDTASYFGMAVIGGANVYPLFYFNGEERLRINYYGPVSYISTVTPVSGNSQLGFHHDGSGNLIATVREAGGTVRTYTLTPNP